MTAFPLEGGRAGMGVVAPGLPDSAPTRFTPRRRAATPIPSPLQGEGS